MDVEEEEGQAVHVEEEGVVTLGTLDVDIVETVGEATWKNCLGARSGEILKTKRMRTPMVQPERTSHGE